MVTEEDRIKSKLYLDFQRKYFGNRKDNKTRFMQLNYQERLEFCRSQKLYVEEEYQKIRYNLK